MSVHERACCFVIYAYGYLIPCVIPRIPSPPLPPPDPRVPPRLQITLRVINPRYVFFLYIYDWTDDAASAGVLILVVV